ncbi:MAG TPA: c-type cytochrome [Candidatus Hydrogenedentes bacterium]|nr:c-type cytochrome [Candidatus Hydrogenedentota bacterium]HQH51806.1 c-type cytochrome [Candidatus Hydrogenedentota bacterium]
MTKATIWQRGCAAVIVIAGLTAGIAFAQEYVSPLCVAVSPEQTTLYVAAHTGKQVIVLGLENNAVAASFPLPDSPTGLCISADGTALYVTIGAPKGALLVMNRADGAVRASIPLGHTPVSPVASPDGRFVYVCNRFDNNVSVIDAAANAELARIAVPREPFGAAVTPDGKWLCVANHLPVGPSDGDYVSANVSIIDTSAKSVVTNIVLPNGSTGLRGIAVSPDGAYAYATHLLGRYQLPTTQLERGWMNTNALSIIDIAGQKLFNTVLLDDVDLGAANPWGVLVSADGSYVCVSHAGTQEISMIDRAAMHDKLAKVAAGEQVSEVSRAPGDVPNDLAFLVGMRRRLKLKGNGARGIAMAGTKVYAAEYFTDSVGVVDANPEARPAAASIPLGARQEMTAVRKGEMLFNDAALCFQNWQSCASCHPDMRADGLNWDLLNDGMGNPKNSKSLLLSHKTPPVMVTGVRDKAETAVRSGIRFIQFAVRPEEDAQAIDEYAKAVTAVPSPYLQDGALSEAAKRGEALFQQAGCAACHPAPLYTDLQLYNVGTGKDREVDTKFDTPTLIEVWRTAPYLHDGRAATMLDMLKREDSGAQHYPAGLTDEQLADLAVYVLSL